MAKFCTPEQKEKWLRPVMEGTASSAYSMTEPDAATSDAVQVGLEMRREGDEYVLNGRKLFANCLWNRDLAFYIVMGRTDAANPDPWRRHSMVIVPCDTPGIEQVRNLNVLGEGPSTSYILIVLSISYALILLYFFSSCLFSGGYLR